MEWQHPEWLYLILPLGAAWMGLALYSRRRRQRAAEAFVAQPMWARILPPDSRARFWMKTLLREVALIAGLVALAGPRFGTLYEEVIPRGSDLYVLIDVSRSMLATDVPPSRLGRAKADVAALVNRLQGERVGLIAFAGQAVVKCPLTVDYDAFRRTLDELDPGSAPRGGTAIGDAIRKALEVFHAKAERDQAILVITDGDDQQSYPLEAATVAAERHVTIFTVGLGDADHGARIPQGAESKAYIEYEGQQVWSKLNGSLLEEIALKTSGVYVPVGTRAYDLGELYVDYLQGRRGNDTGGHKRIRRAEQFQIFLALAFFALLTDLFTRPYRMIRATESGQTTAAPSAAATSRRAALPLATAFVLFGFLSGISRGDDPEGAVREGLRLYQADEFDKARDKFAAARMDFEKEQAAKAAIAAFDEACASHRKGDVEHAREWYLKAGLAHDRRLAAAAHFNLGTLAAEEARILAGDKPEKVPVEKRQEILDKLKAAVASFRHSLELQPENVRARRDIELVRQWIKYYTDKWREHDRQKRRDESNLIEFLEFLSQAQTALRESVKTLPPTAPADAYAELKRAQDELQQEITPLRDKIRTDLEPDQPPAAGAPPVNSKELDEGIKLLESWADAAGEKMSAAARHLINRQAAPATGAQQSAIDELEKIWDAVIPFQPLLARDLADQTMIAKSLEPASALDNSSSENGKTDPAETPDESGDNPSPPAEEPAAGSGHPALAPEGDGEETTRLLESQERTLRRTQLLKLKAEAELERLENAPQPADDSATTGADDPADTGAGDAKPKPIDPEQLKAGYRKAIELAPQAVEQMQAAAKFLKAKERPAACTPAEEARKILEEIQKAQPRNEPPPKQDNPEQKQEDQKNKDEEKQNDDKQKQDKKDQEKKDQEKKDQEHRDQQQKPEEQKQDQKQQVSRDRIEDALRKVRERQQEKRDRDRKMKARLSGRAPVEKDW